MASVVSQLIEEATAYTQGDSLEDAWEICADCTYFPNNLSKISCVGVKCVEKSCRKVYVEIEVKIYYTQLVGGWFMIWYDMLYLLTAIGSTPGTSSTVHIYTQTVHRSIRFVIPVVFIIELEWSVCTCLTQLHDGRDMYRIYYIKNSYIFRHFTLAIFRLRNEKN